MERLEEGLGEDSKLKSTAQRASQHVKNMNKDADHGDEGGPIRAAHRSESLLVVDPN
jgi:hypothetical protein